MTLPMTTTAPQQQDKPAVTPAAAAPRGAAVKTPVDVIVLTFNERVNLPHALASVIGWANNVFVVDSGSTDGTQEIARQMGAEVVEHAWEGYARQKNWAIDQLPIESPWVFILFSTGLDQLDRSVLEASMVDGASYWQRLRTIIFPLMRPVIFVTLSFKALDSFLSFPFVWVLTQGGPGNSTHILSTFIYQQAFNLLDYGNGSAMAIVMLLISGVISVARCNRNSGTSGDGATAVWARMKASISCGRMAAKRSTPGARRRWRPRPASHRRGST